MRLSRQDAAVRPDSPLAAVTGATGFIGRHLVAELHRAGWRVRLLLRREPDVAEWRDLPPPQVVAGALDDDAALERLVEGADVVIHLAGLIKAARRRDFLAVNRDGAAAMARAVERAAPERAFRAGVEPGGARAAALRLRGEQAGGRGRRARSPRLACDRASSAGRLRPGRSGDPGVLPACRQKARALARQRRVARGDDPRRRPGAPDRRDRARARPRRRGAIGRRRSTAGLHLGGAAGCGGARGRQCRRRVSCARRRRC